MLNASNSCFFWIKSKAYVCRVKGRFPEWVRMNELKASRSCRFSWRTSRLHLDLLFLFRRSEITSREPILKVSKQCGAMIIHPLGKESETVFRFLSFDESTETSVVYCELKQRLHCLTFSDCSLGSESFNSYRFFLASRSTHHWKNPSDSSSSPISRLSNPQRPDLQSSNLQRTSATKLQICTDRRSWSLESRIRWWLACRHRSIRFGNDHDC